MFLTETNALDDLDPMRAALGLAEACSLAYHQEESKVEAIAGRWEWEVPRHFRRGTKGALPSEDWGFAAHGQNALILVFRGADSLADWLSQSDWQTEQVDGLGGIHSGILAEFNALRPELEDLGGQARDAGHPIWIAGHGLGGAVALLSAALFRDDARLVTFGQPRIVDATAAERIEADLDGRYFRFVNHDDVVPRIPPGFHHCGLRCAFDLSGALHRGNGDDAALEPEAFLQLEGRIAQIQERTRLSGAGEKAELERLFEASLAGLVDGISSHRIDNYIDVLRRNARRIGESSEDTLTVSPETMPVSYRLAAGQRPESIKALTSAEADNADEILPKAVLNEVLRDPEFSADAESDEGVDESEMEAESENGLETGFDSEPPSSSILDSTSSEGGGDDAGADGEASSFLIPAVLDFAHGWAPDPALRILSKSNDRVATVLMTGAQHSALRMDQNINRIEISRNAGFPELKRSLVFTHGDAVHRPPLDERGDSCVFALIDTGIDILHEAFSDGNGGTRVKAIWHQADDSGPSPHAIDPAAFSQDYGRLYLADELDQMVRDARANAARLPDVLRDDVDLFSSGHGTHVASIGAGRGFGALPGGMAPDAPIIVVIPNLHTDKSSPESLGYSLTHVGAVEFLSAIAMQSTAVMAEALPMVVNVSLGMNAGPHDGKTPLEIAFTMATQDGTRRGFAIVKSAGNESGESSHVRTRLANRTRKSIFWTSANESRPCDYLEVWWDSGTDFRFKLFPPAADGSPQSDFSAAVEGDRDKRNDFVTFNGNAIQLTLVPQTGSGNQLIIEITTDGSPIRPGKWELEIAAHDIGQTDGVVDAWAERIFGRQMRFFDADDDFTISIPGTVKSVICVGASDSDDLTAIGRFSSRGLTRDNIAKPDLTAPGVGIEAARAGLADHTASEVRSGTSMAAPHVAGALALVLSRRQKAIDDEPHLRQFTADQLRQAAIDTARDPARHQLDWGHGKLDARAFYEHMLTL